MSQSKNIIKKMTVDVETNSMSIGLQIKEDISGFLKQNIFPKIDQLVHKNVPDSEIWKYDRIEIDLSLDEGQNLDLLTAKIVSDFEKATGTLEVAKRSEKVIFDRKIPRYQNKIQAFKEYLKSGKYPWWFDTKIQFDIQEILSKEVDATNELSFDIFNSMDSLKRITYQFTNQDITYLFKALVGKTTDSYLLPEMLPHIIESKLSKELFWKALFSYKRNVNARRLREDIFELISISKKPSTIQSTKSIELGIPFMSDVLELCRFCTVELDVPVAVEITSENSTFISLENQKSVALKKLLHSEKAVSNMALKNESGDTSFLLLKDTSSSTRLTKDEIFESPVISEVSKIDLEPSESGAVSFEIDEFDGLLIENAGLVLIHPFIKHFFQNLDLLEGTKIQEDKIDRAVHILHYLATKKEQPYEYELIFEKFLCGIPESYPINRFITLTDKEKESCSTLLEAILSHWDALKTNSIDALRSEFLMRDGKLTIENEVEKLYVERKTQDILLDRLPWNISMVKIPWKSDMLYVEW